MIATTETLRSRQEETELFLALQGPNNHHSPSPFYSCSIRILILKTIIQGPLAEFQPEGTQLKPCAHSSTFPQQKRNWRLFGIKGEVNCPASTGSPRYHNQPTWLLVRSINTYYSLFLQLLQTENQAPCTATVRMDKEMEHPPRSRSPSPSPSPPSPLAPMHVADTIANIKARDKHYIKKHPGSFPQFARLPPEIRQHIWRLSAKPFRVHTLKKIGRGPTNTRILYPTYIYTQFAFAADPVWNARLVSRTEPWLQLSTHNGRLYRRSLMYGPYGVRSPLVSAQGFGPLDLLDIRGGLIHVNGEARATITSLRRGCEILRFDGWLSNRVTVEPYGVHAATAHWRKDIIEFIVQADQLFSCYFVKNHLCRLSWSGSVQRLALSHRRTLGIGSRDWPPLYSDIDDLAYFLLDAQSRFEGLGDEEEGGSLWKLRGIVSSAYPALRHVILDTTLASDKFFEFSKRYPQYVLDDHAVGVGRTISPRDLKNNRFYIPADPDCDHPDSCPCAAWDLDEYGLVFAFWYWYGKLFHALHPQVEVSYTYGPRG
ncbi:hypothetical protein ACRALDRAFT_206016 [Sodiomyces alcalophilus JCM 7366]|uniref:uncharacterized protein n=1 Tax=Sodiomyces alcalophilus JCM 7366 TaxID=591952 RepID=UPI0039B3AA46